ncbi:hypothetical protein RRF57_012999 [Xylaria bambusicola]|uniref:Zn(2)-C6 fungal-type domain-containing protein n=1 Tax=Xylaria bambusicola TaxID=326684 RepID=A0AAN7UW66_9PEZI
MELCDSIKFRQSCDKCQNSKVRCSRDKPICKRCAQRQFRCIYSPLRRTGRPRKVESMGTNNGATSRVNEEDGSPTPTTATAPYGHASQTSRVSLAPTNTCEGAHIFPLSPVGSDLLLRSVLDTWGTENDASPIVSDEVHTLADTPRDNASASAISVNISAHTLPDCYTAILARTTKLEQVLAQTTSPPTIDFVLEAERDFNRLRHRLFACTGHEVSLSPDDPCSPSESTPHTTITAKPCPATGRPVLLGLSLLAERVVTLLEEMFRQAAKSAQSMDQATDFIWSKTPGISDPSARRTQRSLRNATNKPCVSVGMESYRALCLGDFVVEAQAKADVLGHILKLRVKRMLRALGALHAAKQTGLWGEPERGQTSGGPLDWGTSTQVLHAIAGTLLDDLIRRMESLQGAMVFL